MFLTIWWLGNVSIRWLTRWTNTSFVLGRHTEMILSSFFQTQHLVGQISCPDNRVPTGLVLFFPLKDVLDDLGATVRFGWLPGDSHFIAVNVRDFRFGWSIWNSWNLKNGQCLIYFVSCQIEYTVLYQLSEFRLSMKKLRLASHKIPGLSKINNLLSLVVIVYTHLQGMSAHYVRLNSAQA